MKGLELCRLYYERGGRAGAEGALPRAHAPRRRRPLRPGQRLPRLRRRALSRPRLRPRLPHLARPTRTTSATARSFRRAYDALPREFRGFERKPTQTGAQRVGVMSTSSFYSYYIGCPGRAGNADEVGAHTGALPGHLHRRRGVRGRPRRIHGHTGTRCCPATQRMCGSRSWQPARRPWRSPGSTTTTA